MLYFVIRTSVPDFLQFSKKSFLASHHIFGVITKVVRANFWMAFGTQNGPLMTRLFKGFKRGLSFFMHFPFEFYFNSWYVCLGVLTLVRGGANLIYLLISEKLVLYSEIKHYVLTTSCHLCLQSECIIWGIVPWNCKMRVPTDRPYRPTYQDLVVLN